MSATIKHARPMAIEAAEHAPPSILDQILDRVDAIAVQQARPSPIGLKSWEEIERFAVKAAKSGMVPKDYIGKPESICIAVMMGAELGLAPMQSLQNIACINGRPSIWGDAMPGLIRASGKCAYIKEWSEGEGETLVFCCEAKRKDDPTPIVGRFGVAEAKKAGLWGKDLYAKYPQRMLLWRARGFALRDAFPDVLRGLISAEEAADIPPDTFTGTTIDQPAAPPPATTPPRRTARTFLDALKADLAHAETADAVDEVLARDDVEKAKDTFTNGARSELYGLIQGALDRTRPDGDETTAPNYENDPAHDAVS